MNLGRWEGAMLCDEIKHPHISQVQLLERRLLSILTFGFLISLIFFGSSASAWYAQTHYQMTLAAYNSLPQALRDKIPRKTLLDASNEPDGTVYDPQQGYRQIKAQNRGCYHGDPRCIRDLADKLSKALQQNHKDWNSIALLMGQLAHHIQDLNQPYHAALVLPSGYSERDLPCHDQFEERAKFWMSAEFRTMSSTASYMPDANNIGQRALKYLTYVRPAKCVGASDPESCCRDHAVPLWVYKEIAENSVRDTAGYWTYMFNNARPTPAEPPKPPVTQTTPGSTCEGGVDCGDYCCPTPEICSYSNKQCADLVRRLGSHHYHQCKKACTCWPK